MSPGAFSRDARDEARRPPGDRDPGGIVWPSVIAILFAVMAATSFAVEHSVTLSSLPEPPGESLSQ